MCVSVSVFVSVSVQNNADYVSGGKSNNWRVRHNFRCKPKQYPGIDGWMDGWMTCDISGIEDMYHIVNRWPCHVHCHTLYHLGGNYKKKKKKKKKILHNIFHPKQELP